MVGILSNIVMKINPIVTKLTAEIFPTLKLGVKKLVSLMGEKLPVLFNVIDSITDALGVIDKEKINCEELGKRVIESNKKIEDFETKEEMIFYFQENIESQKKQYTNLEKIAFKSIGGFLLIKGLEEKLEMDIEPEFWVEAIKTKLDNKEILAILQKYSQLNIPLNFVEFLKGELSYQEKKDTNKILIEIFKELTPDQSKEDIKEKIMKLEDLSNEKGEQLK